MRDHYKDSINDAAALALPTLRRLRDLAELGMFYLLVGASSSWLMWLTFA